MKSVKMLLLFSITLIIVGSCSSGKRAFENGDYYRSVIKSVERLRKNPDHRKSKETLDEAYPAAIDYLTKQIEDLKLSGNRLKWGEIVSAYEQINSMADEIRRSPGARKIISNPRRYGAELT
ncbi:MAG: hypothetical protein WBA74_14345, partial [Cyclobacteriaceae bacterium]